MGKTPKAVDSVLDLVMMEVTLKFHELLMQYGETNGTQNNEVATTNQHRSPPERASKPISFNLRTAPNLDMVIGFLRLSLGILSSHCPGLHPSMTRDRL
jgi:hypothetical protein